MQLFQTNIFFFNLLSVILGTHPWPLSVYTVKIRKVLTPEKRDEITVKFAQYGFIIQ